MSTQKKLLLILIATFILLFLLLKGMIQGVPEKEGTTVKDGTVTEKNKQEEELADKEDGLPEKIRVLLRTSGYEKLFHDQVTVTSEDSFTVCAGSDKKTYEKGKKVTIKKGDSRLKKGKITITSDSEDGTITVLSVKRGDTHPSYRGSLELKKGKEGICLVNELKLEEYLYSVVPSEMPNSYGLEALKVQAVCARTYAYARMKNGSFEQYGAHLDDSVASQVYNNTPETKESIQAVKETSGQILTYKGKPVSTYYFSTSCGHTASAEDVWLNQSEVSYFAGSLQTKKASEDEKTKWGYTKTSLYENLSKDNVFRRFLADETFQTYDSDFPWYRWRVSIASKDLENVINDTIASRYEANPELILTKNKDGDYVSKPIKTIGKLKGISLGERADSGILTYIIIKGSKATVKVLSEYNIRVLLAPQYDEIYRQDNTTVSGMDILPSAFLILDKEKKNNRTFYLIQGGGYGHGVGMSQNGVPGMVKDGYSYEEILLHYYKGAEITKQ